MKIIELIKEIKYGIVVINKEANKAIYSDYKGFEEQDISNMTFTDFLSIFPTIGNDIETSVDIIKENSEAVVIIGEIARTEEECRIIYQLFDRLLHDSTTNEPDKRTISALIGIYHVDKIYQKKEKLLEGIETKNTKKLASDKRRILSNKNNDHSLMPIKTRSNIRSMNMSSSQSITPVTNINRYPISRNNTTLSKKPNKHGGNKPIVPYIPMIAVLSFAVIFFGLNSTISLDLAPTLHDNTERDITTTLNSYSNDNNKIQSKIELANSDNDMYKYKLEYIKKQFENNKQMNTSNQVILYDHLLSDPITQNLLKKIEQTKKSIAELEQKEFEEEQVKITLKDGRMKSLELQQDLEEWEKLLEKHSSRNAFEGFVSKKPEYVQGVFWDQFEFEEQKVKAGREALKQVVLNGGSLEDAREAYYQAAEKKKFEILKTIALLNEEQIILIDQKSFNLNNLDSLQENHKKIAEYYNWYPLNYTFSSLNSDTKCKEGYVAIERSLQDDYMCTRELTTQLWELYTMNNSTYKNMEE